MKVVFLDIDGVLATPKQFGTVRTKLYKKEPMAMELRIPYMWDERCVIAFNRFIRTYHVEIVLSSDWRLHFSAEELDRIFKMNGVAKSPIGYTQIYDKTKPNDTLEILRVREIQDYVAQNKIEQWCAVDDMSLGALGTRFVQTDYRMGFGEKGFIEKMVHALHPELTYLEHGIYQ